LTALYAENTKVTNIDGIGNLKKLRLLYLHDTPVKDLAPLLELHTLEELDVAGHKPLSWDFLASLTSLRVLDLGMTSFKNLILLSVLPNLELVRLPKTHFKRSNPALLTFAKHVAARGEGCGVSLSDNVAWKVELIDPGVPRGMLPRL
jgi:Leucine-rich repeat (LRR) protein